MYLFELWFCPDICPGIGLLDHMATLFLAFWGTSISFPVVTALLYIPTNNQEVFLLSTPSPAFGICRFFNDGHSDQCEVVSEKAMAPHSSTLAWKIPWTEEPGGLQSMGSLRVGHNWATSLSLFTFLHWRRKRQPTPVFLPGESQGRGSLVGCSLWGRTGLDTTEAT